MSTNHSTVIQADMTVSQSGTFASNLNSSAANDNLNDLSMLAQSSFPMSSNMVNSFMDDLVPLNHSNSTFLVNGFAQNDLIGTALVLSPPRADCPLIKACLQNPRKSNDASPQKKSTNFSPKKKSIDSRPSNKSIINYLKKLDAQDK